MKNLVSILCLLLLACARAQSPTVAIRGVTVVDVQDGSLHPEHTVLVSGNRITAVGPGHKVAVPDDAEIVEAAGQYLIPGLWDMHAHLLWEEGRVDIFAPQLLAFGVTSARDIGGGIPAAEMVAKRRALAEGVGPRILIAGNILEGPRPIGYGGRAIRTAEEGRAAVHELADAGVDFIKVYWGLSREAYLAISDEAARRGLPVAGHVPFSMLASEVAAAGQRSIEHLNGFEDECTQKSQLLPEAVRRKQAPTTARLREILDILGAARWDDPALGSDLRAHLQSDSDAGKIHRTYFSTVGPPDALELVQVSTEGDDRIYVAEAMFHGRPVPLRFVVHKDGTVDLGFADAVLDSECVDRLVALYAAQHVWQCPTLIALAHLAGLFLDEKDATQRLQYLPRAKADEWRQALERQRPATPEQRAAREKQLEQLFDQVRRLQRAGVPLLVGTDVAMPFSFPGLGVHDELAILVRAGLTPHEALEAATVEPARYAGLEKDLGTIAPGKIADLVLLDGNPLDQIENTRRIAAVVLRGRLLDRKALDGLLEEARSRAQK